ncbi:MAG: ABC transporter ATP-binding protein [Candidatus Spechtbacteria bacterium]|nr:ABC transporter ATP-binding protein [Candidatus Spechtbacteria bacterium]
MFAIKLENISKDFDDPNGKRVLALKDVSMEISPGEFFVIAGPSGSGKSTLLRIMSGLEKKYTGEVMVHQDHSRISFVFQQFALLPWLTVFKNVELGLVAQGIPKAKRKEKVMKELSEFGLADFADSYPRELSGGMRQRVGVARALVNDPKIVFMDEPFSELDSFTAQGLRKDLLELWRARHPTIVMVTHVVEDAVELADRIAVFTPQPGTIKKIVQNNLPRPRDTRSSDFYRLEDELYELIKP